jgi:hypothetical protein
MPGDDHNLAHCKSFRSGSAQHVRGCRIHKHMVGAGGVALKRNNKKQKEGIIKKVVLTDWFGLGWFRAVYFCQCLLACLLAYFMNETNG